MHSTAQHSTAQHSTAQLNYNKEHSTILSGVAILLMLFHHFFGFPEWLKDGISCIPTLNSSIMISLAMFSKLCVAIFAFNTGYAMWTKQESYTYSKITSRIFNFLIQYWVICILFIGYALLAGDTLPTLKQFGFNLFGVKTSTTEFVSCGFAWYVYFYIIILILSPIILKLYQSKGFLLNCAISVGIIAATKLILYFIPTGEINNLYTYIGSVLMGIMVCKFKIFQVVDNIIKPRHTLIYLSTILLVIIARKYLPVKYLHIPSLCFDAIWVVVFIFCILGIIRNLNSTWIEDKLSFLGKYSMNMWFVHAIFFTGTLSILQEILYLPKYSIFVYIWGIILVLPVAILCSYIQKGVLQLTVFKKSTK